MSLETLLGDFAKERFVAEYLHRLPFSLPGAAGALRPLGSWSVFSRVLKDESSDVMVVRRGAPSKAPAPRTAEQARRLLEEGHTLLVRHAERHHAGLKELAAAFEEDLHAPANVHMYVTPPNSYGFPWHYDAEDVFIIQTAGSKQYSLRKNTVNPWPLVETIPADMRYERELMPVMQVDLMAGDWLYIPCGYWHKAETKQADEPAVSLALGVISPSALDVFDFLRTRLLDSLLWRQRLPVGGSASHSSSEELDSRYAEILNELADDLSAILRNESFAAAFRDHLASRFQSRTRNRNQDQQQ